jgi:hypothetical protein
MQPKGRTQIETCDEISEIPTVGEEAEFKFEIKETDIVSMDKENTNVTGVAEGETTVSFKTVDTYDCIDRYSSKSVPKRAPRLLA